MVNSKVNQLRNGTRVRSFKYYLSISSLFRLVFQKAESNLKEELCLNDCTEIVKAHQSIKRLRKS